MPQTTEIANLSGNTATGNWTADIFYADDEATTTYRVAAFKQDATHFIRLIKHDGTALHEITGERGQTIGVDDALEQCRQVVYTLTPEGTA